MARKIKVKLILELREQGMSRSAIARTRHISKPSVCEVFDITQSKGLYYRDVAVEKWRMVDNDAASFLEAIAGQAGENSAYHTPERTAYRHLKILLTVPMKKLFTKVLKEVLTLPLQNLLLCAE